jgi:polyphosphate kinase
LAPDRVPPAVSMSAANLKQPSLYINRELSWLEFNQRVLDQAGDPTHPLLERVKFLGIAATNLDEFYMIRVSAMLKKLAEGGTEVAPDGLSIAEQLEQMRPRAARMLADVAATWGQLRTLLAEERISFLEPGEWTEGLKTHLATYFTREIRPVLTPLAFDPGHPFPFISNLSKNFAVVVRHGGQTKFARLKVPDVLPRFIVVPSALAEREGIAIVFLEDVIRASISELFPGTQVKGAHLFRVIRDADLEIAQVEADDLLETVDKSLKQLREGAITLLQVGADMPPRILRILVENFESRNDVVLKTADRMGFGDWRQLLKLGRPDLKDAPFPPRHLWRATESPEVIFDLIRERDQFVHHPFESFASVEAFVRSAVTDPQVVAIKMTLYRIGPNSPLIDLLVQAAEAGKQVAVLLELKARFDERNNIIWARRLESHGIHVVYGFADLKTHAKLCLVVRKESDGIRSYLHTATGNYNAETAKVYTDLGIFTADPEICADVAEVFNYLTGYSSQKAFRNLLVAPLQLRARLDELITREMAHAKAGRPARIVMKVNAITDDQIVRMLYRASQAGVFVDLIARGICCLKPGVAGVSDRIQVRSVIGRFLEHSRLMWFHNGGDDELYLGSADLMERNLDRRVEILMPVRDPQILEHLREVVIEWYLRDTTRAYVLAEDGNYTKPPPPDDAFDAQDALLRHYTDGRDIP